MYGYIYKTTNLINHKFYIGQHHSEKFDESYKGSGKLILKAFKKYGFENFSCEILEWCETPEQLDEREIYYISMLCVDGNNHYNIAKGGNSGDLRKYLSESELQNWKDAISKAKMGQKRSEHSRRKQSESLKGHITSEETKEKIRQSNMGHEVSEYTRQRVSECSKGRIPYNKGIPCTDEHKKAQSKSMSGRKTIEKGGIIKRPPIDKLQDYLNNGWKLIKE